VKQAWLIASTETRAALRELAFHPEAGPSSPLVSRLSPRLAVPAVYLAAVGYVACRAWRVGAAQGPSALQEAAWMVLTGIDLLAVLVGLVGATVTPTMLRAETEHLLGLPVTGIQLSLARLLSMLGESTVVLGVLALPAVAMVSAPAVRGLAASLPCLLLGLVVAVTLGAVAGAGLRLAWIRLGTTSAVGFVLGPVLLAGMVFFLGQPPWRAAFAARLPDIVEHLPVSSLVASSLTGRLALVGGAAVVAPVLVAVATLLAEASMRTEARPPRRRPSPRLRVAFGAGPRGGLFGVFLLKDAVQYWRSGRAAFSFALLMVAVLMAVLGGAGDPQRGGYFLWTIPMVIAGQYVLHAIGQEGTNLALIRLLFPATATVLVAKAVSGFVFTATTGSLVYLAWQAVAALTGTASPDLQEAGAGLLSLSLLSLLATVQAVGFGTLYADLRVKRLAPHRGTSGVGEALYWLTGTTSVVTLRLLCRPGPLPSGLMLTAGALLALTLGVLAGAASRLGRMEMC